jgi:hypothetical protein
MAASHSQREAVPPEPSPVTNWLPLSTRLELLPEDVPCTGQARLLQQSDPVTPVWPGWWLYADPEAAMPDTPLTLLMPVEPLP